MNLLVRSLLKIILKEILYNNIWKPTNILDKELTIKEIENLEPIVELKHLKLGLY